MLVDRTRLDPAFAQAQLPLEERHGPRTQGYVAILTWLGYIAVDPLVRALVALNTAVFGVVIDHDQSELLGRP